MSPSFVKGASMPAKLSAIFKLSVCLAIAASLSLFPQLPTSASALLSGYASLKQAANNSVPYSVAVADSRPAVVEFYAEWCSVCRSMVPTVDRLRDQYGERINFVMLDIDDPRWSQQLQDYRVMGVPHFAMVSDFKSQFEEHFLKRILVGKQPSFVLAAALEELSPGEPNER